MDLNRSIVYRIEFFKELSKMNGRESRIYSPTTKKKCRLMRMQCYLICF